MKLPASHSLLSSTMARPYVDSAQGVGIVRSRRYRVLAWILPLLILSWLSLALVDPNPVPYDFMIAYFFGSLFAHATLAAAWGAFGPGAFGWRFPLSMVWLFSLPAAVGINIAFHGGPNDGVVVVGGALLGQWLALQFPLWALVVGFGLHVRHGDEVERGDDASPIRFGIRHLLVVMLIVGVILGIGRVLVANVKITAGDEIYIFAFLAAAAIVLTLPLLLAALMRKRAVPGVLLALVLVSLVMVSEYPLLIQLGMAPGPDFQTIMAINAASAILVLATALVLRWNGFCLYTRGRKVHS
jgi:hypothetical protein